MNILTKTKIDQLGTRLRGGHPTPADLRILDEYRRSFSAAYEQVVRTIREELNVQPTGRRAKSVESLVAKLRRESIRLSQVQDIAGCRVVVSTCSDQANLLASVCALFSKAAVVDRRQKPNFGYRAVHVIVRVDDKPVEVQVRTALQHLWAEFSEKAADKFDAAIKYGGGSPTIRNALNRASEAVQKIEDVDQRLVALLTSRYEMVQSEDPTLQEDIHDLKDMLADTLRNAVAMLEEKNRI